MREGEALPRVRLGAAVERGEVDERPAALGVVVVAAHCARAADGQQRLRGLRSADGPRHLVAVEDEAQPVRLVRRVDARQQVVGARGDLIRRDGEAALDGHVAQLVADAPADVPRASRLQRWLELHTLVGRALLLLAVMALAELLDDALEELRTDEPQHVERDEGALAEQLVVPAR